jgi:hypothetical protein
MLSAILLDGIATYLFLFAFLFAQVAIGHSIRRLTPAARWKDAPLIVPFADFITGIYVSTTLGGVCTSGPPPRPGAVALAPGGA